MNGVIQNITVLGCTGSIGVNTLDVVARHPDRFQVFALAAATRWEVLLGQCAQFKPRFAVLTQPQAAKALQTRLQAEGLSTQVLSSPQALLEVASAAEVDCVMAAIVGAAGLPPCMAAARAGKRVLLANKEALVVGGPVFLDAVRAGGATLIPIDSEHSAIFQALPQERHSWPERIEKLVLTASGGAFLHRDMHTFADITPAEAVKHPTWVMGPKISVDSATLMNKALEVIEAHYLFGVAPEQIEVVIHPQSVVHSMVQFKDTSIVAQLGTPDMRVPIAYGLSCPARIASGAQALDWSKETSLTFCAPCVQRFPSLPLAWAALHENAGPILLNAANEVAVEGFLRGQIRYDQIHTLNAEILASLACPLPDTLEAVLEIDRLARGVAGKVRERLGAQK